MASWRLTQSSTQLAALPGTVLGYTIPDYFLSPLYCNSVLANLNSRQYVRTGRTLDSDEMELSTPQFKAGSITSVGCSYIPACRVNVDVPPQSEREDFRFHF
jgi:hypothetical protein